MSQSVVVFMNKKGGVGKTTLSNLLAEQAESEGKKVTFLSVDPQKGGRATDEDVDPEADLVVIDTPGHIDESSAQVIELADVVVIPTIPGQVNEGSTRETIELVRKTNPGAIRVVLLNEYSRGRKASANMVERFATDGGGEILLRAPFSSAVQNADDGDASVLAARSYTAAGVVRAIEAVAEIADGVSRGLDFTKIVMGVLPSPAFVVREVD